MLEILLERTIIVLLVTSLISGMTFIPSGVSALLTLVVFEIFALSSSGVSAEQGPWRGVVGANAFLIGFFAFLMFASHRRGMCPRANTQSYSHGRIKY